MRRAILALKIFGGMIGLIALSVGWFVLFIFVSWPIGIAMIIVTLVGTAWWMAEDA